VQIGGDESSPGRVQMKIAIVAPSPVPFTVGGAENLFWGLQTHLNQHTPHDCELIKLPSPEQDFWSLLDSYERFACLDLSHFDAVISTKYPAWMVRHPRHIVYMLHKLRGLYDTYHYCGKPLTPEARSAPVRALLDWMSEVDRAIAPGVDVIEELFARLVEIRQDAAAAGEFEFPGPLARRVVHFMDDIALEPGRVHRYAAISSTVKGREAYFPDSVPVHVAHPPSNGRGFHCGADDYLFTVSRLDGPKRIGLLVEAMGHVRSDIRLLIAGTGPSETDLRDQAADDPRIEFLGFVNDSEVVDYYANALAVPFVPLEEDYGLITVEAMMSAKPVLTTLDSGGPTELVEDGVSGFISPAEPEELAARINALCNDRARAREMGRNGRDVALQVSWENVASVLLGEDAPAPVPARKKRKTRIVLASTFPIYPPRGGGQTRIFNLYSALGQWCDTEVVSLAPHETTASYARISETVTEYRVPRSRTHAWLEAEMGRSIDWLPIDDVAAIRLTEHSPQYLDVLSRRCRDADFVVVSHPFLFHACQSTRGDCPLWYEAHNVEFELKRELLGGRPVGEDLLADVFEVESACWRESAVVFACSSDDLDTMEQLYGESDAKRCVVPNGTAMDALPLLEEAEHAELKSRLDIAGRPVVLFVGSWHPPNLEAARHVMDFAREMPDVLFILAGSSGNAFDRRNLPRNVLATGELTAAELKTAFATADLAVNPMIAGSGTNLKILDYMASGLPVVSTPFGVRGLSDAAKACVTIAGIGDFPRHIRALLARSDRGLDRTARTAREEMERSYSWTAVARNFHQWLSENVL
jgi:glycosyltransferase involved in cell wall biosynthesis